MSADTVQRALGPVALLLLAAASVGLFVRADLQRAVRLESRDEARSTGTQPDAPLPRKPSGLDHRGLTPEDNQTAHGAEGG